MGRPPCVGVLLHLRNQNKLPRKHRRRPTCFFAQSPPFKSAKRELKFSPERRPHESSETRCWAFSVVGSSGGGKRPLLLTSLTIQRRDRTLTSCPCSGAFASAVAMSWFPLGSGVGCTRSCLCWLSTLFSLREKNRPIKHVSGRIHAIWRASSGRGCWNAPMSSAASQNSRTGSLMQSCG